jgi:predicted component of type VI protein secretion system
MRRRIEGFIALAALLVLIAGCDNQGNMNNRNAVANANANANANATVATTPVVNANTNTRQAPTREETERDKE